MTIAVGDDRLILGLARDRPTGRPVDVQVAYGVSSLFYMFLKTQGISPSSHPVKGELDRIR